MFFKDILLNIVFPFPTLFKATKLINNKIEKLSKSTQEEPYTYEYASNNKSIDDKVLLDTLKDTIENKKILEDKAKSSLIAITILGE
jgi:CHASE3 domain sensor protein